MKKITLYRGTTIESARDFLRNDYSDLSWWSDNYQTVEHYYEGCVNEMVVEIDDCLQDDYIRELEELVIPTRMYMFGLINVDFPVGVTWYSFGRSYLNTHVKSMRVVKLEDVKKKIS